MIYYCPKDFKNGRYFFNRYDLFDLTIMVPTLIIGTLICITAISKMSGDNFTFAMIGFSMGLIIDCVVFLMFLPVPIFHNLFQRMRIEIDFISKQKAYLWLGFDFNNYEESD